MDSARVKTFFILILLLLNGFLLAMVLSDRAQANRAEASKRQEMQSVLQERGITLSDPGALDLKPLRVRELGRDLRAEAAAMRSLLGADTVGNPQGSGVVVNYSGSKGTANFHNIGNFGIYFKAGKAPDQGDLLKTAQAVMAELGLQIDPSYDRGTNETGDRVEFRRALDGLPVYNYTVKFTLTGEKLAVNYDASSLDTVTPVSAAPQLDICTLLLRFLDNIRKPGQGGLVCTEICSVTQGYVISTNLAGQSVFSPTLCVETDTGTKYLDCVTGNFLGLG
ncbi:MAG: hypothetical protein FWC62_05545 [Firmicutes bacterium]|nr:hypothetical protein [Bacillota bacterium]